MEWLVENDYQLPTSKEGNVFNPHYYTKHCFFDEQFMQVMGLSHSLLDLGNILLMLQLLSHRPIGIYLECKMMCLQRSYLPSIQKFRIMIT